MPPFLVDLDECLKKKKMEAEEKAGCLPENEMMVSTVTGCTASPSVAITVREWPSNVI